MTMRQQNKQCMFLLKIVFDDNTAMKVQHFDTSRRSQLGRSHLCSPHFKLNYHRLHPLIHHKPIYNTRYNKCTISCSNFTKANVSSPPSDINNNDIDLFTTPLDELMRHASSLRDQSHHLITFSPKVFIPLTRLCRDNCGYCTFALDPVPTKRAFMTIDEVLHVARLGAEQGCTEALFTLGMFFLSLDPAK